MNNSQRTLTLVIALVATDCQCNREADVEVSPEPLPRVSATSSSVVAPPTLPVPVPSVTPVLRPTEPLKLLPEHEVYTSAGKRAVIDSRAVAQSVGRPWSLPYPYQLIIIGDAVSIDCGFFPTLQGAWRIAYCLEGNERHSQKLYIWDAPTGYGFSLGDADYTGFSVGSKEEQQGR